MRPYIPCHKKIILLFPSIFFSIIELTITFFIYQKFEIRKTFLMQAFKYINIYFKRFRCSIFNLHRLKILRERLYIKDYI